MGRHKSDSQMNNVNVKNAFSYRCCLCEFPTVMKIYRRDSLSFELLLPASIQDECAAQKEKHVKRHMNDNSVSISSQNRENEGKYAHLNL